MRAYRRSKHQAPLALTRFATQIDLSRRSGRGDTLSYVEESTTRPAPSQLARAASRARHCCVGLFYPWSRLMVSSCDDAVLHFAMERPVLAACCRGKRSSRAASVRFEPHLRDMGWSHVPVHWLERASRHVSKLVHRGISTGWFLDVLRDDLDFHLDDCPHPALAFSLG